MSPKTNSCHYIVSTVIPTHVSLQRDNKICLKTGVLCMSFGILKTGVLCMSFGILSLR